MGGGGGGGGGEVRYDFCRLEANTAKSLKLVYQFADWSLTGLLTKSTHNAQVHKNAPQK